MPLETSGENCSSCDPAYWALWEDSLITLGLLEPAVQDSRTEVLKELVLTPEQSFAVFLHFLEKESKDMGGDHAVDMQPFIDWMHAEPNAAREQYLNHLNSLPSAH